MPAAASAPSCRARRGADSPAGGAEKGEAPRRGPPRGGRRQMVAYASSSRSAQQAVLRSFGGDSRLLPGRLAGRRHVVVLAVWWWARTGSPHPPCQPRGCCLHDNVLASSSRRLVGERAS